MDTKLITKYGEEILCYRLRSARQKIRSVREDADKYLIQLAEKRSELRLQERNLGWDPLVPPVQKGWVRSFELRADVARSKYADFFQNILNKINTREWSYRKDFKIKKRKKGRKQFVVKEQYLYKPNENSFHKMNFGPAEKQMFYEEFYYCNSTKRFYKRYVFAEPWRFVLRVRPNMITKIRRIDSELSSEIANLDNLIDRNVLYRRIDKIKNGGGYKFWKWKESTKYSEVNPYRNKSLNQILDTLNE